MFHIVEPGACLKTYDNFSLALYALLGYKQFKQTDIMPDTEEVDVEESIEEFKRKGLPWVDLSNKHLTAIPTAVNSFNTLQYLNLNTNCIKSLPESFFEAFPLLSWLDLRFNNLSFIPSVGLASHSRLQIILLQNNKIKSLPLELGFVKPLRDIHFANNPLEFPPADVLSQGTVIIKNFLAAVLHTNRKIPQQHDDNASVSDDRTVDDRQSDNQSRFSHASSAFSKKKNSYVPTGYDARNNKPKTPGGGVRPGAIPENHLPSSDLLKVRAKEQSARSSRRKINEKIDKILQHRKDVQARDDWRDEAKSLQRKKELEKRLNGGRLDYDEPATMAPFGVNNNDMPMKNDMERRRPLSPSAKPRALSPGSLEKMEQLQKEKDIELTSLIKDHMSKVMTRSRVKSSDARMNGPKQAGDELAAARKELEIAQRLQSEVTRRRKEMEFRMKLVQQKMPDKPGQFKSHHQEMI